MVYGHLNCGLVNDANGVNLHSVSASQICRHLGLVVRSFSPNIMPFNYLNSGNGRFCSNTRNDTKPMSLCIYKGIGLSDLDYYN